MTENELKHRINNAIILLTDGHPFNVGDLTFGTKDKHHFSLTGWTHNNDLKNLSKKGVLTELNEVKVLFMKMTDFSPELTDFIKDKQVSYYLGYDYGMGSLDICYEEDGEIKWIIDLEE